MKYLLFIFFPLLGLAQTGSPVQWQLVSKKLAEGRYALELKGLVDDHWHLYAQNKNIDVTAPSVEYPENIRTETPLQSLDAPQPVNDAVFGEKAQVFRGTAVFQQTILVNGTVPSSMSCIVKAFAGRDGEFLLLADTLTVKLEDGVATSGNEQVLIPGMQLDHPAENCGETQPKHNNIIFTFLLGLLGGLVALCTPCVFPMIPVTVSFFTGKSKDRQSAVRNGLLYGFFIIGVYLLASVPFHLADNMDPQFLNSIATNPWVNLTFFAIFVTFALSFFGLFEISLPSSLSNLAGSKSRLSSVSGIFFMALTLVLVSFSCTGPILGSLLVGSLSSNGAWQLTAGMSGFGLALGLPFALFAMFPQWLKRLPKSGSWMEVVKKSLAFVELALALKFLSNADLVEHWGILKREVFIGLWIIISLGLALYLLRVFEQKKGIKGLSQLRQAFGIFFLVFSIYLTLGLTRSSFADLKLLSGFPPPETYSLYSKAKRQEAVQPAVINDYQKGLALAKQQHKPVLIDFTGWACVNCRKMEENVWTDPAVSKFIRENYVLVSLYVDDRKKLPVDHRFLFTSPSGKETMITTVGDRNAVFQAQNFGQVTQPLYAILSPGGTLMNHPIGYTPEAGKYRDWLQCGYNAFSREREGGKTD